MQLQATNFSQLKKELKPLEGKAIFKLTRINSMNDGTFARILHQVKPNELVFFDGRQLTHLEIKSVSDIEFMANGFKVKNCTFELMQVKL